MERLTSAIEKADYISFEEVSARLKIKPEFASRYINPELAPEWPYLGEGLRIEGDPNNWNSLKIHAEDAEEFIRRLQAIGS